MAADLGSPEDQVHHVTVDLTERQYRNLEVLTTGPYGPDDVAGVIGQMVDHVDQGIYRSGAWEREWLCSAFGYDWLEHMEQDPRWPDVPSWQRPKAAPHAGRGRPVRRSNDR